MIMFLQAKKVEVSLQIIIPQEALQLHKQQISSHWSLLLEEVSIYVNLFINYKRDLKLVVKK